MGVGGIVDKSKVYFHVCCPYPNFLSCFASNACRCASKCLSLREQMLVAIRASCSSLPREREPFGGSRSNHCRNFRRCLSFTYTSSAQVYVNGLLNRRGRAVCNATPTPTLPRCASLRGRGYLVVYIHIERSCVCKRVAEQAAEGLIGGRRCNSCRNPRRYAPSPCGTSIARVAREDWGEGSKREK